MMLWHSPLGQVLLYGSLATHAWCGRTEFVAVAALNRESLTETLGLTVQQ
jgi:hypothetical protein